ncbi:MULTISPECIES: aspartate/glutamate racemase family protein [Virgibacillus]|uniref:Aspartate/glutamate racemase family protein n=1 Tax=Virgibacillus salarius TaxID=447199 RepID=A0A941I8M1_9BACI|nr:MULTISPECIES: aspartate/glutamate racemase family protein [Virgibacillus]MBR7794583.1 aspartate/glutamate racemase family protein [Virgibacillus salarius]MDY7045482.1 aspartate/glutamate racemase family protein [Virgibacillus sp. M23]NAZ07305.1 amino acid racemase [Agaribacter marinus]
MKTIGLIGGMSWESTALYYRIINEEVNKRLGELHSAKCLLYSVDFQEIESCQATGDWEKAGEILSKSAHALEKAGADFLIICTNTMHKVVPAIEATTHIPILHIANSTAEQIKQRNCNKVGLLGTNYTMEQNFYISRLREQGIQVIIPKPDERERVNAIIFNELCLGEIKDASRTYYKEVIQGMIDQGAEGIILGCTEIGLLIGQDDAQVPLFDTAKIHAIAAVNKALTKGEEA